MAEAKSYAQRNRQGSDWFNHDDANKKPEPEEEAECPDKNGEEDPSVTPRTQMIKPVCMSNDWFKHEKPTEDNGTEEAAQATPGKGKSSTNRHSIGGEWYSHETKEEEKPAEVKLRVGSNEGKAYCRRDKTGSSSSWFAHEHDGQSEENASSSPRVNTAEGSNNAVRMRGQSENWFGHDEKAEQNGPQHTSKGRGVRPQSTDMHHIFHMEKE